VDSAHNLRVADYSDIGLICDPSRLPRCGLGVSWPVNNNYPMGEYTPVLQQCSIFGPRWSSPHHRKGHFVSS
jgi:hypothetical protein